MMKFWVMPFMCAVLIGCATTAEYNPVASATSQRVVLNEAALKSVSVGMPQDKVHELLGQELVVGYAYQDADASPKPLTIANPYRVKEAADGCTVEYYVTAVRQPDGVVSDDELMPLLFCKGALKAKGWDQVK